MDLDEDGNATPMGSQVASVYIAFWKMNTPFHFVTKYNKLIRVLHKFTPRIDHQNQITLNSENMAPFPLKYGT